MAQDNYRPRINKADSQKDKEQKSAGARTAPCITHYTMHYIQCVLYIIQCIISDIHEEQGRQSCVYCACYGVWYISAYYNLYFSVKYNHFSVIQSAWLRARGRAENARFRAGFQSAPARMRRKSRRRAGTHFRMSPASGIDLLLSDKLHYSMMSCVLYHTLCFPR